MDTQTEKKLDDAIRAEMKRLRDASIVTGMRAALGAVFEGVEEQRSHCAFLTGHVHGSVDDVSAKVVEVQPHLGQVPCVWLSEREEDAIEIS